MPHLPFSLSRAPSWSIALDQSTFPWRLELLPAAPATSGRFISGHCVELSPTPSYSVLASRAPARSSSPLRTVASVLGPVLHTSMPGLSLSQVLHDVTPSSYMDDCFVFPLFIKPVHPVRPLSRRTTLRHSQFVSSTGWLPFCLWLLVQAIECP